MNKILIIILFILALIIVVPNVSADNCTELWIPSLTPSTCINGTQLLTYTDLFDCQNVTNSTLPIDNGTIQSCNVTCESQICTDPIYANVSCCMVTPTITCTAYTYELYDNNGVLLESNTMTLFNQVDNSYFFNFNKDLGTYYIKICDDSTRQVIVSSEDNMIGLQTNLWVFIIFVLLFILIFVLAMTFDTAILVADALLLIVMVFFYSSLWNNIIITIFGIFIAVLIGFLGVFFHGKGKSDG